jgi:hypothetical protein
MGSQPKRSIVKPRRAAALALVGWYLMLPLVRDGKVRDIPISEWVHIDSFDTAAECRDNGLQQLALVKRRGLPADRITAFTAFECIATDDPRLKGN